MSKIVQAVNTMISNQDKITNVVRSEDEFFFTYLNKQVWSMRKDDAHYFIYYYPTNKSPQELASLTNWDNVPMVAYGTAELKTREALESFTELYGILSEKVYGMDKIFEEILNQDNQQP